MLRCPVPFAVTLGTAAGKRKRLTTNGLVNHSTNTRDPVPFAVTTPTDAIDKTATIFVLEGGVGATSSKTTSSLYIGVTQKVVTTLHGKGWFKMKATSYTLISACHKGRDTYTCTTCRIIFAFSCFFSFCCKARHSYYAWLDPCSLQPLLFRWHSRFRSCLVLRPFILARGSRPAYAIRLL